MVEFGSLFAGVGGFDLGFERAGMTCVWQGEIDVRCNEVLAYHWSDVQRYGDVRDVGKHNLEPVDLICGGFPCQGLSVAGRRAGLADERSGLWWEFARIIEELRPRWIVIENVPGLLSSNGGRDMGAVVGTLAQFGYGWAYRVLDAQYFGVAQRRRRVFIVGCLGDRTSAAKVLFESESLRRDTAPRREAGKGITAPVKASAPGRRNGGSWPIAEEFVVTGALNSGGNNGGFRTEPGEHLVARPLAHSQTVNHYDESQQTYVPVAFTIQTNDGGSHRRKDRPSGGMYVKETKQALTVGSSDQTVVVFDWQSGGDVRLNISEKHTSALQASQTPAVAWGVSENQRAELRLTPYSRQITGGGGKPGQGYPAALTQHGVRRLTPTECERLQGFPDGWTAVNRMKDTPRYRMLGNAVCVPMAAWIGGRILAVTDEVST